MLKRSLLFLGPIISFSCPTKEHVFKALTNLGVPVKEVKTVEVSKTFKGLCKVEGVIKKGKHVFRTKFYLTEDGKYLIPFVGKIEMVPSKVLKGWKELHIRSLRNPKHELKIGLIDESGKYFISEIFKTK
jgi:hypothetical protein